MKDDADNVSQPLSAASQTLFKQIRPDWLTLIMARHGQRGGPPIDRYPGKSLTPMGHRQAKRLAKRLAPLPLDQIYTSDMARAYQTAEPIRELRPDVPFEVVQDLRELSVVDQPNYPPDLTPEERERLHHQRVARVAEMLLSKHGPGDVVLLVAHGGMIRWLLSKLTGIDVSTFIAQHHTSVSVASINQDGRVVLRLANCTRHLRPSQINGDNLR